MPDKHRVKADSVPVCNKDINYVPFIIAACVLIVVIFLIYKLFSKVTELRSTITGINVKLDKLTFVGENTKTPEITEITETTEITNISTEVDGEHTGEIIQNKKPNGDPGPSGVIKEEISEDLKSMDIYPEINEVLKPIGE